MDKRIIPLLIIIALGIWANVIATICQPTPTFALGELDVNIAEVGGKYIPYGAPIDINVDEIDGLAPWLAFAIPVKVE